MDSWGEACVPPSARPLERGGKLLTGHLELASGSNMFQRVYKSCAQQQKKKGRGVGGSDRRGPWWGRITQKKTRGTLSVGCSAGPCLC